MLVLATRGLSVVVLLVLTDRFQGFVQCLEGEEGMKRLERSVEVVSLALR